MNYCSFPQSKASVSKFPSKAASAHTCVGADPPHEECVFRPLAPLSLADIAMVPHIAIASLWAADFFPNREGFKGPGSSRIWR